MSQILDDKVLSVKKMIEEINKLDQKVRLVDFLRKLDVRFDKCDPWYKIRLAQKYKSYL